MPRVSVPADRVRSIPLRAAASSPVWRRLRRRTGARVPATSAPVRQQRERERRKRRSCGRSAAGNAGPPPINREITISEGITVKELSEKLDVKANFVIKKLVDRGIFATINQTLDAKLATDISREFGASTATVSYEEEAMQDVEDAEEAKDLVTPRRPWSPSWATSITVRLRCSMPSASPTSPRRKPAASPSTSALITSSRTASKIVFIDTPGHEAFTRMRARGAKVTDIVVLVVAADDGVMPQTLEAIDHASAAKVPIIVAINKIDKPDAQPDRIKQQLSDRGLLAEDWGGDTVMVPVSARTKQNLDLLLEMILLVAEMQDLKANPSRPAMASVLEAKLDRGRGPVATVLVRNGTLHVGDYFICGAVFGRVRAMLERSRRAGPRRPSPPCRSKSSVSMRCPKPATASRWSPTPPRPSRSSFTATRRRAKPRSPRPAASRSNSSTSRWRRAKSRNCPIILKADVGGSAEVLTRHPAEALHRQGHDARDPLRRGRHQRIATCCSPSASNAIIIGFNVRPERNAAAAAEQEKVDIRLHTIIYKLMDEMKKAMTGLLAPVFKEVYRGKAEVREVFRVTKVGTVAGCHGHRWQDHARFADALLRDNVVVHTGKIGSLRRFKDDVSEVRAGMECGITLDNFARSSSRATSSRRSSMERVATEVFA